MDAPPAVAVRDLRKLYGNRPAVDGLTLTVPRGCFFGFLGPNGAGKTTTIKMLMGLIPPTSGSIELFEGVDAVGARLMKDILLEQVARGATIFLTSHVLEVVERLCDRVAIIHDGRLAVDDSMDNLRSGSSETLEDIFVRIVGGGRT